MYRDDLIRAAKAAKQLTNDDIAKAAGLSSPTISGICNGDRDIKLKTLQSVAGVLGLQMDDLFTPKPEEIEAPARM